MFEFVSHIHRCSQIRDFRDESFECSPYPNSGDFKALPSVMPPNEVEASCDFIGKIV